ncbi:ABC transporter permease [Pelosinus propionicus]|uniref:Putative hemin transport system permease protein HrtB n=1 Tax=Pelosinus propionicus DSM 13327 TaxID=1123291 RepID=A0A1I4GXT2_9FIRM|nr:ABC transporter permease [Pelosinus propionicus]SFL34882.1 putative ABC transport system permease protein [Pelosinus propionicus DSM 13327]
MRLLIAWRNLLAKPVQSGLTVLIVAATIAMLAVVTLLSAGTHAGLVRAVEPFDLIVGAKGSPNQLVLNTVFFKDVPIGNVSHEIYEKLSENPLVASAIPLAFGDNYRGYTIVGSGSDIFSHEPRVGQGEWLQFAAGRPFSVPFEAVVGAKAAQELGLKLGDEFKSAHGFIPGGHTHDHVYQVVGILQPVSGPYDQAVLVPIESIWLAHEKHESKAEAVEDSHEHEHEHEVTAILVKPKGYSEAMRLYQQFQQEKGAQMIFPAQVIVQLFSILGQGEQMLRGIAYVIIVMGLMIMALSVYWSALGRARDRSILRALGASTRDIFNVILAESALLSVFGVVIGIVTGHGIYSILVNIMESKTAIVLTSGVASEEIYITIGGILFGILAGLIPAVLTYKMDVAKYL